MPILLGIEECNGYTRFLPVTELDPEKRKQARKIYAVYKLRGVITSGTFNDDEWNLTDETKRTSFKFAIDRGLFDSNAKTWIGCTADCYQECIKAYAAFQLGRFALPTINQIVKDLKRLAITTADDACSHWKENIHIISFLSLIPDSNASRDTVIEWLEEQGMSFKKTGSPRRLADFSYYLRFHEMIRNYWEWADETDKIYYFPIYLWWNLTAILPLRATEFLLLSQDCIRREQETCILTIRRTRMKKGKRKIAYTVDKDYEQKEYEIPERMAAEIMKYQEATAETERSRLKTLFITHGESTYGFFTYAQARQRLRCFCKEIAGDPMYPIRLGDTRHLAMINLILSGGSPVICRELAGHESIDISSNYYANLSSVLESTVYDRYHGWKGNTVLDGSLHFRIRRPIDGTKMADGWCDVPEIANGDIAECMKSYGAAGHIGDCRNCLHFYPNDSGLRLAIEKNRKNEVDEDVAFLVQMIEQVRRGNGYTEDIQTAMLRLQNSAFTYESTLAQRFNQEGF